MSGNAPQTGAEAAAPSPPPTILTLRVYHEKTTFKAALNQQFGERSTENIGCSCSRVNRVWLGADSTNDESRRTGLLPETPTSKTVMRFVFRSDANIQKARDICSSSHMPPDSEPFRRRMLDLMNALAALCQGGHQSNQSSSRRPASGLRPFRLNNLDVHTVSEELRRKIMSPLAPSEALGQGLGYIYILRSQVNLDTMSVLKIGFSKFHPEHRSHELAGCLTAPEVVAHTPLIPHAKRIETLIHAELVAQRKVQACDQCGQEHREWFTISHAESRDAVIRWSRWILEQPYRDGKLSDKWHDYLQQQDFASFNSEVTVSELWEVILGQMPGRDIDSTPESRVAAYMSSCYWDNLGRKILGPLKGKFGDFHDTLHAKRSGQPLESGDCLSAIDKFLSPDFLTSPDSAPLRRWMKGDGESQSGSQSAPFDFNSPMKKGQSENRSASRLASEDFDAKVKQVQEQLKALRNLKTGAVSVSDPELGKTESPLGDATLLPVVSLKTLRQMDAPARDWIGYNPTHEGFQFLQEAYQRGEWAGNIPQFQLPRAFRKSGVTKLPAQTTGDMDSDASAPKRGPRSQNQPEAQTYTGEPSGGSHGRTARLIRSSDGDKLVFTAELNDDFKKQVNELTEVMKFPIGRALAEREMMRGLKHYGLSAGPGWADDAISTDSESSADEMSVDAMNIDEPEGGQPEVNMRAADSSGNDPANESTSTPWQNRQPDTGLKISKAGAKRWLESI